MPFARTRCLPTRSWENGCRGRAAAPVLAARRRGTVTRILGYPRLLVLGVAWKLVGTVTFARNVLAHPGHGRELAAYFAALSCYLPWVGLSALVMDVERRFPLGRAGWARNLALLAAVSLPVVHAAWILTATFEVAVQLLFGHPLNVATLTWIIPGRELLGHELLYWASVAAGWMTRTMLEAREAERRAARLMLEKSQLETSLRQTELDSLRMRLHPHFLFNSLQNISVLTQHDPQTGSRMLTRLGELLRASLNRDTRPETTLQAEVALTRAYLAIEQMRFGDRLSSIVEIAPGTEHARVPAFLLQPLVENAIRHGLRNVRDTGVITIASRIEGGSLVLSVTDNGTGPPGESLSDLPLGIGLGATCERLARMYPGRHSFSMQAVPSGGTEVRITLPLAIERAATMEESDGVYAAVADRRR